MMVSDDMSPIYQVTSFHKLPEEFSTKLADSSHGASEKSKCWIADAADDPEDDSSSSNDEELSDLISSSPESPSSSFVQAWSRITELGEGFTDGLELGVHGGVQGRSHVSPIAPQLREVEPRGIATELERGPVVGQGGLLGGVEGPEPEAGAVAGEADFRDPFAPVALPDTAEELRRLRKRRQHPSTLHRPRMRSEEVPTPEAPALGGSGHELLLALELSLDVLRNRLGAR
ncbi:hypothetical protein MUK42_10589 [Musa troglodytarum]|uniref:Uncharacterized protein n=1 Tax=Musa troglodytarum TaxID=320322 RepID=A0A9E7IAF3_9LILI|nr:hypothetical protein MUK42_10589 [Musa troglodytarum]